MRQGSSVDVSSNRYVLHFGDCLDILPSLGGQSVGLILADLPYGTTRCSWDAVIPFEKMWPVFRRVRKRGAATVLTACMPFTAALVMSNVREFRHHWVWEKNKASGHLNAKRAPMRAHEDVVVFCEKAPSYTPQMTTGHLPGNYARRVGWSECYGAQVETEYGGGTTRYPRTVQAFDIDDPSKVHPTQKPVDLMRYLVRTYSKPGDVVLDVAMGSGTTGEAALLEDRFFIGIEKDGDYFDAAWSRLVEVA